MKFQVRHLWVASLAGWCLMNSPAMAQFISNFEPPDYTGSGAGTLLAGQQAWYNPVAGSTEYNVFSYPGNALGLPVNPTGGTQFVGATGPGTNVFARAQHDVNFNAFPRWTMSYDVAHRYTGTLPTSQNLGSFSTANPASATPRNVIALHTWADIATGTNWNAQFNVYDAANVSTPNLSPGAAWNNLSVDNWYRESITMDFTTNSVLEVSITDLTTGVTNTANPVGWFLQGGATGSGLLLPTSTRFFAGGGGPAGNTAGWDNLSVIGVVPEPSSMVLLGMAALGGLGRRYRKRRAAV